MSQIPLHSYDLIADLNKHYPEVIYDPREKHEEFLMKSGERRLVKLLLQKQIQDSEDNNNVHGKNPESPED